MRPIVEVEWIHFDTIDSTSSWAREHAAQLDPKKITCITAETQTAGYGTRGKNWVSESGNLHMTLFFRLSPDHPNIPNLGQLLSFACLKALPSEVEIKWPNDLVYRGKKLCGVLVETISLEKEMGILMGLGMNVNTDVKTDQETTSLFEITKKSTDLYQLAQVIVHQFQIALKEGFGPIREEYIRRLAYRDEPIRCLVGDKEITGTLIGLDKKGRVQIQVADGGISTFWSGEIHHLRKI